MDRRRAVWRIAAEVPERMAAPLAAALEGFAEAVCVFGPGKAGLFQVEGIAATRPRRGPLSAALALVAASAGLTAPDLAVTLLRDRDWLAESRRALPPVRAGRFFLHGTHIAAIPPGALALRIDAGLAFGTGHHETTLGCLLALDMLGRRRRIARGLDLGCGSGVLAMAMARLWRVLVLAADIDPDGVRVATANVRANGLAALVRVVGSDGFRNPLLRRSGPFDLIAANILAGPLMRLAPDLARHLAPAGVAVLSGLLDTQEAAVLAACRAQGLALRRRLCLGAWTTLVVGKGHRTGPARIARPQLVSGGLVSAGRHP